MKQAPQEVNSRGDLVMRSAEHISGSVQTSARKQE
jgi:hypothetical protein